MAAQPTTGPFSKTQSFLAEKQREYERGLITKEEMDKAYASLPFSAVCGKYEDDGEGRTVENCKYDESFICLEDAVAAYERNQSYHWNRIEFRQGDFVYELDLTKIMVRLPGERFYQRCDSDGTVRPSSN